MRIAVSCAWFAVPPPVSVGQAAAGLLPGLAAALGLGLGVAGGVVGARVGVALAVGVGLAVAGVALGAGRTTWPGEQAPTTTRATAISRAP